MSSNTSVYQTYAEEAQKRLRSDGLLQFQDAADSSSARIRHLADDVWVDQPQSQSAKMPTSAIEPGSRVKFMIVGAGIAGLLSAVRLILAGFPKESIRLVESAGGVGGTWYWNRYPGLHCDVESYVYMPLLEEMGYVPSQKYASGVEIRRYLQKVVEKYELQDKICLQTKVESLQWDEQGRVWKADFSTAQESRSNGDVPVADHWKAEAEIVILTAGYLAKPQVPKLDGGAGVDGYKGDMFHTARWDYTVTGGSSEHVFPELDKLRGKKVGILGTGATAIQVVPCLAKYAKELYVFQRTPSAVYSRGQQDTDLESWKSNVASDANWQSERRDNMAKMLTGSPEPGLVNLVNDEWTKLPAYSALVGEPEWAATTPDKIPDLTSHFMALDAEPSARLRARVADIVQDKTTADALTPWYPAWCKRPTFSDTYLETFNEPHVHLVDTAGRGIDGVTATSVVVKDTEYPVDVLVLATGYISPTVSLGDPGLRTGIRIVGREGKTVGDKWASGGGMATLHGVATSGFPNLFWLGASQGPATANFSHAIDSQAQHIAYILQTAHKRASSDQSAVVVEVQAKAEEAWSMRVLAGAARWATFSVCTPGYLNSEGSGLKMAQGMVEAPSMEEMIKMGRMGPWAAGLPAFLEELAHWREGNSLDGYDVNVI